MGSHPTSEPGDVIGGPRMDYRVLGPLEVTCEGQPIEISGSRKRIVLSMLLFDADRVVSVSRLVAALWDAGPPATARNQVQICVSALRRQFVAAGAGDTIVTRPPGYALRAGEDELDVRRFERYAARGRSAAAEGRATDAVRELREGLGLWRGPAAAGVDSRIVQVAATRLNESRLAVWEDCIALELELGRHRDLIGELTELVAEHPLRERLRAQLMLALYRAGRQADALASYRTARQTFADELGLDLSRELRDLEHAILDNDPTLHVAEAARAGSAATFHQPMPIPRQLPPAIADFTGRADLLHRLHAVLIPTDPTDLTGPADPAGSAGRLPPPAGLSGPADPAARAAAGQLHVPVAVLTGRSGVGKTSLALQAAHLVRNHYPDGQLYARLHGGQVQPANPASVLERFLRALAAGPVVLPSGLDELTAMYRTLLADRRILVVLDDAYSAAQVTPLLPGVPSCAVIVTNQRRLLELPGAHRVEVDAFDEATGIELLARVLGASRVRREADAALALVRLCGRLPLALRIAAAKLAGRPHWTIARMVRRLESEEHRLDELVLDDVGIRSSISTSYQGLGPVARTLFRRLSILGESGFSAWVGAPLLDSDMEAVTSAMDQLVDARLVEVHQMDSGAVRFGLHDLIRLFASERLVAEEPAADRTAALHRLLRGWLFLARAAHRAEYGGVSAIIHGTERGWEFPDEVTADLLRDPLRWFRDEHASLVPAIRSAAQAGLDELCWELALLSVTLFESGSFLEDWQQTHLVALTAARDADNPRGEAAMMYSLGSLALVRQSLDEALGYLEPALARFDGLGDTHGRALALRNLAFVDRLRGRYDVALTRYQGALAGLREVGDQVAEANVLGNLAQVHLERGGYDVAERMLDDALTIARRLGAWRTTAQTRNRLGDLYLGRQDLAGAESMFMLVLRAVRAHGDRIGETHALHGLGLVRTGQRRYPQAEANLRAALDASTVTGDRLIRGRILLAVAELREATGQPAEALAELDQARELFDRIGSRMWQARARETAERLRRAT